MKLYIGFGANIGQRAATIYEAIRQLGERIGPVKACSSLYETAPVGFSSPNRFLNAVAEFDTTLSPEQLLLVTQDIEKKLGRRRKSINGFYCDRTIDIDLLWLENTAVCTPEITLPHPRMTERRFVLEPLHEIAPELVLAKGGLTVSELLKNLSALRIRSVGNSPEECEEAATALNRLMPSLTEDYTALKAADVARMLSTGLTRIYLGRDESGKVQAGATLVLCCSPTGCKAWIEDVAVMPDCRRRGYGRAIIRFLIAESQRLGAKSLNLTSQPKREAANALYRSEGFVLRETNVYRWQEK